MGSMSIYRKSCYDSTNSNDIYIKREKTLMKEPEGGNEMYEWKRKRLPF